MRDIARNLAVPVLFLMVLGCAAGVDYKALDQYMGSDGCLEAAAYIEEKEESYGTNRRLLFLMDAASVNMYCSQYEKSNQYFHEADTLAEDLWTKSVTKEAAAFLLNDYTRPYSGEDFERALVNMLSALNYALMGDYAEALVEVRRLNSKLTEFNDKYEEKNVYKEDAFGRYLSGMIYEADGADRLENIDSAFIDYSAAVDAYRDYEEKYGTTVPDSLVEDYLRIAEAADRLGEAKRKLGPLAKRKWTKHRDARKLGKIVFIHLNGRAPEKSEDRLYIQTPSGPITLAFPKFVVREPACRKSEMELVSSSGPVGIVQAEMVEDITGIAVKNLDDRKGRVIVKAIARAVVKQVAINEVANNMKDEKARKLTKLGLNIVNLFIERADTRSWRTLPAEISMARMYVPEGQYDVFGKRCGINKVVVDSVYVRPGQTKFVLLSTVF